MGVCIAFYNFIIAWMVGFANSLDHTTFKTTITATFITLFVAAVTAYVAAAKLLMAGLVSTMPDFMVGPWSWVMPSNFGTCVTAIGGCYMLRFFTKQYLKLFEIRHRAVISN